MKAFVHKIDEKTGRVLLGSDNGFITKEYQSFKNLKRYALKNKPNGKYLIEAFRKFHDGGCYEKADIAVTITIKK